MDRRRHTFQDDTIRAGGRLNLQLALP